MTDSFTLQRRVGFFVNDQSPANRTCRAIPWILNRLLTPNVLVFYATIKKVRDRFHVTLLLQYKPRWTVDFVYREGQSVVIREENPFKPVDPQSWHDIPMDAQKKIMNRGAWERVRGRVPPMFKIAALA